ncbi:MAG TPA: biotin/lipoyl-binding protein, partial [Anaerolineales bacterium]
MFGLKKAIFLLVVLSLALSACASATPTQTAAVTPVPASAVIAEGHLFPEKYTSLSFLASGVVAEVKVSQGDKVKQGDELLRLE